MTSVADKELATRLVEGLEAWALVSAQRVVDDSPRVRRQLDALESWSDGSPFVSSDTWSFASTTAIQLARGYDSKARLLARMRRVVQAALPGSQVGARIIDDDAGGVSVAAAAVGGFGEGLAEGGDDLWTATRALMENLDTIAIIVGILAGVATITSVTK